MEDYATSAYGHAAPAGSGFGAGGDGKTGQLFSGATIRVVKFNYWKIDKLALKQNTNKSRLKGLL